MTLSTATHNSTVEANNNHCRLQYLVRQASFLTKTIMRICLVPDGDSFPYYKIGQYCQLEGADGKFRSFSIVNQPNSVGEVELHVRVSEKNQGIARQLVIGKRVGLIGPCGKEKRSAHGLSNLLIAEGIGLAAINQLVLSGSVSPLNSMIIWLGKCSDMKYLALMSETWLNKYPDLPIKKVALDMKELVSSAFNYYHNTPRFVCYFAGSPKLKEYMEQNFIKVANSKSERVFFVSDL